MGKKDNLEETDVDGTIKLKWIFKKLYEGVEWTNLAQDRDKRPVLVNTVMILRVEYNAGNFLSSGGTVKFL